MFSRSLAVVPLAFLGWCHASAQQVLDLQISPAKVVGGSPITGTVTLTSAAPTGGFTVSLVSNNPAVSVPSTMVVPAGSSTGVFSMSTTPVAVSTLGTVVASGGGTRKARSPEVRPPSLTSVSEPALVFSGRTVSGLATLEGPAPAGGMTVALSSNNSLLGVPASVVVPAGATSQAFPVTAGNLVGSSVSATITGTLAGVSRTRAVSVLGFGVNSLAPWPRFRGDALQTGYAANALRSSDWSLAVGSPVLSSPAVGPDGTVYFGANNGNVYAVAGDTGVVKWTYKTGGRVQSSPALSLNNVLYVGSADGHLYALNAATGSVVWRHQTGGPIVSSPCMGADGRIYVGSFDAHVYALDRDTGKRLWRYRTGGAVNSSPNVDNSGRLVFGSNDGSVYALSVVDGSLLWKSATGGPVTSSPAVSANRVYVGSNDGSVYCLSAWTGAKLWTFATWWSVHSSPALDAFGNLLVGSDDGFVYSLKTATGALNWIYATGDSVESSPAVDPAGNVYVGSDDGFAYAFRGNGSLINTLETGAALTGSATVSPLGEVVFGTASLSGKLLKRVLIDAWLSSFTKVLQFNRSTDTVQLLGGVGNGGVTTPFQAFTVESVFRLTSSESIFSLWQQWRAGLMDYIANLAAGGSTFYWADGFRTGGWTSSGLLSVGTWHHAAWVYDGSQTRLYINGTLVKTESSPGTPPSASAAACAIGFNAGRFDHNGGGKGAEIALLRISKVARYTGASVVLPTSWGSDTNTLLNVNPSLVSGTPTSFLTGGTNGITASLGTGRAGVSTPPLWAPFTK